MNRTTSFLLGATVLVGVALGCWYWLRSHDDELAVEEPTSRVEAPAAAGQPALAPPAEVDRRVAGVVLLPDGRPAAGARLQLCRKRTAWPEWQHEAIAGETAITGADGAFRFASERQPQLLLAVAHPQHADELLDADWQVESLVVRLRPAATVRGRVLGPRGQPVPGARVSLEATLADDRRAVPAVRTEADGSYRFDHVAPGALRIVARHDAWQPAVLPSVMAGDERVRELRFEQPAAVCAGRVVDALTEAPIEGALVRALQSGQEPGRSEPVAAQTGAAGEFSLRGLARGSHRIDVLHPAYGRTSRTLVVGGARDEDVFELQPRRAVRGRLLPPPDLPLRDLRLLLRSSADELAQAPVAADGTFRFEGRFTSGLALFAIAGGAVAFAESSAATVQARISEERDEELQLPVVAPAGVAGHVLDERGQPLRGARLSLVQVDVLRDRLFAAGAAILERNLPRLSDPLSRSESGNAVQLLAVTGDSGAFRILGLPPGSLQLRVEHPGSGTRSIAVEVPALGAIRNGIEARMATACSIVGRVRRGRMPVPGVQVAIRADGVQASAFTGLDGRYAIGDLPPGSYRVHARYSALTAVSDEVATSPGRPGTAELEFAVARTLSGNVVDQRGQPVEGATVAVVGSEAAPASSDVEGRFQLELELEGGGGRGAQIAVEARFGDGVEPVRRMLSPNAARNVIALTLPDLRTVRARVFALPGRKKLPGVLFRAVPRGATGGSEILRWIELQGGVLGRPLLPEGRFRVQLWAEGYAPFVAEPDERAAGEVDLGEVLLEPGCELRGRVVDDGGRPVVGAEVALGDSRWLGLVPIRLRTDLEGSFALSGVASAADMLVVRARGFAPLEQRLRLPQDVLGTPIQLQLGRGTTLQVALALVSEGVVVIERGGRAVDSRDVDDGGLLSFENLAPGDYEVRLLDDPRVRASVRIEPGTAIQNVLLK